MVHPSEAEDPDVDMQIIQALLGGGFSEPAGAGTAGADATAPQGEVPDFEALLIDVTVAGTDLSAEMEGDSLPFPVQQAALQPDLSVSPKVFLPNVLTSAIKLEPASAQVAAKSEAKSPLESAASGEAVDAIVTLDRALETKTLPDAMAILPSAETTDRTALPKAQFEPGETVPPHQGSEVRRIEPERRQVVGPMAAQIMAAGKVQLPAAAALAEPSVEAETVKETGRGLDPTPVADPTIETDGIALNTWQASKASVVAADNNKASTNATATQAGAGLVDGGQFVSSAPQPTPLSPGAAAPLEITHADAPTHERKSPTERRSTTSNAEVTKASAGSTLVPIPNQDRPQGDLFVTDTITTDEVPLSEVEVSPLELKNVQGGADLKAPIAGLRPNEYPRQIALQVADIARLTPDKPTELVLNPEELGRLRVTFHTEATTMNVVLQFERPETLDLMRRHIDMLGQEMRDLGYESVNFAFHDQGGNDTGEEKKQKHAAPEQPQFNSTAERAAMNPIRVTLSDGAGIDIRI